MRFYTGLEVDLLIDYLSDAAVEAIEQAAAEAARAAALAGIEREAAVLREAERWRREAVGYRQEVSRVKRAGVRNVVTAVLLGALGGFVAGWAMK